MGAAGGANIKYVARNLTISHTISYFISVLQEAPQNAAISKSKSLKIFS